MIMRIRVNEKLLDFLPRAAALWAAGASLYLLFGPTYQSSSARLNMPGVDAAGTESRGHASALDVNGPHVVAVLGIPVVLALSPLLVRKQRRAALLAAGALTLGFCVVAALSVGTFYLPTALLLLIAAATTDATR